MTVDAVTMRRLALHLLYTRATMVHAIVNTVFSETRLDIEVKKTSNGYK